MVIKEVLTKRDIRDFVRFPKQQGIDMIIDTAQNATMLYHSAKADHTQAVIDLLKTK